MNSRRKNAGSPLAHHVRHRIPARPDERLVRLAQGVRRVARMEQSAMRGAAGQAPHQDFAAAPSGLRSLHPVSSRTGRKARSGISRPQIPALPRSARSAGMTRTDRLLGYRTPSVARMDPRLRSGDNAGSTSAPSEKISRIFIHPLCGSLILLPSLPPRGRARDRLEHVGKERRPRRSGPASRFAWRETVPIVPGVSSATPPALRPERP